MKPFFSINCYILTDSRGEQWEDIGTDGTTRRFVPGTARFNRTKEFSTLKAAKAYGQKLGLKRWRILHLTPPSGVSRVWEQETVFESGT